MKRFLLALLLLASCDNPAPGRAVVHWSIPRWDSTTVASAAKADLLILPLERIYAPECRGTIARVKALNPRVKIIGYLPTLACTPTKPEWWSAVPFQRDYEAAVGEFRVYTMAGDSFGIWPGQYFLNPMDGLNVNRELIHRVVRLLKRYHTLNTFYPCDGVMHDYSMTWIPGGERVDFDGDGFSYAVDINEQECLRQYQLEMYDSIRVVLGGDYIQIANGQPAQTDAEFGKRLNGVFFECYPRQPWKYTPKQAFAQLMQTQREGWLRKAQGRTWNVLSDWNAPSEACWISSLIAGCFYADSYGKALFTGWASRPDAGKPTGNASVSGNTITRQFERGKASITFEADGSMACKFEGE